MTICGIFAHLPHFTFFIAYLPYDHHMSVTHGVANMQSAKKSVANVQIPRLYACVFFLYAYILAF
jgi:hypothetical protein